MKQRVKIGVLVASSTNKIIPKEKIKYLYVEKLLGNVIIKTIIK